jgi:hypothetical protein
MNIKLLSGGGGGKRGYPGGGGGGAPATPLIVGSMFGNDITEAVAMPIIDTYYPVADSLVGGFENGMAFQNDSEILATVDGVYAVVWDMAVSTPQENPQIVAGCVTVDNVPCLNTQNITYPGIADFIYPLAGCGFIQITADQVVRLALKNTSGINAITLNQASLTLIKIAEIPVSTLISHWPGDDSPVDIISGHDAVWVGVPEYSAGFLADCFKLGVYQNEGIHGFINIPHHSDFDFLATGQFTIEFYWKETATEEAGGNVSYLFSKGVALDETHKWCIELDHGGILFYFIIHDDLGNFQIYSLDPDIFILDVWRKIKVTYDAGLVKLYIDDALIAPDAPGYVNIPYPETEDDFFFKNNNGEFCQYIDEIKLYRTVV